MRILLYHYYGVRNYSVYADAARLDSDKLKRRQLGGRLDCPKSLLEMAADAEGYFVKTHELPLDDSPAIHIVRDGRDALISYAWFVLGESNSSDASTFRGILRDLILSDDNFGGWSNHVLAWSRRRARTVTIRYEDLCVSPQAVIRQVLRELGREADALTDAPLPAFPQLQQQYAITGARGRSGAWREEMPPDLEDLFWSRHRPGMDALGYARHHAPDEITRGQGWYPAETYLGDTFHWIANDAELTIHRPSGERRTLFLEVEPGPGLNGQALSLQVLDQTGQLVANAAQAAGRQEVEVTLPLVGEQDAVFRLHIEGGGAPVPDDPRILNFRIFRFGWR